jgi:hypothetical protein
METLPRQKYTKEFREQAVRLVIEQDLTIPEAARQLSMSCCQGAAARYALMTTLRPQYPLTVLCRVLAVSRSGYHAGTRRRPSKRTQDNARLEGAIQAAHVRTRQTYGPERLRDGLKDDGLTAGVGRIKRLRKKLGLRCKPRRTFTATTDSTHHLPVAPNLLGQKVASCRPHETWVTDITYIPTGEGWLYLAGIKDLHSCEVRPCDGRADEHRAGEPRAREGLRLQEPEPVADPPLGSRFPVLRTGLPGVAA